MTPEAIKTLIEIANEQQRVMTRDRIRISGFLFSAPAITFPGVIIILPIAVRKPTWGSGRKTAPASPFWFTSGRKFLVMTADRKEPQAEGEL